MKNSIKIVLIVIIIIIVLSIPRVSYIRDGGSKTYSAILWSYSEILDYEDAEYEQLEDGTTRVKVKRKKVLKILGIPVYEK